jgi:hypothetical protein
MRRLNEQLHLVERVVFPPQTFVSAGFTIIEAKCNICDGVYGECNHIKNRVYMGRLCTRIITKWEPDHVAIVDTPANKNCRIVSYGRPGNIRNLMTGRLLDKSEQTTPPPELGEGAWSKGEIVALPSVPYEEA